MKKEKIILVANGNLFKKKLLLNFLKNYDSIICTDGAANKIINLGLKPNYILGDLDSIYKKNIKKYKKNIIELDNQNYSDLYKSLSWIKKNKIKQIDIIGIDGRRIDHSIANFNIILEYIPFINITIFTEYGNIYTINKKRIFKNCYNKNISIFSASEKNKISTSGLQYELNNHELKKIYSGTLNKAINNKITIKTEKKILVFISN